MQDHAFPQLPWHAADLCTNTPLQTGGKAGATHRPIHNQSNQSHDEDWTTPNDAGNKQNVVAKRFRINVCAIDMKMDSLNPQDTNSSLGGSTDVRFQQIDHQKKNVLWAVRQQACC
jgi:hypothetical protein